MTKIVVVLAGLKGPNSPKTEDGLSFADSFTTGQLAEQLKGEAIVTELPYQWPAERFPGSLLQTFSALGRDTGWQVNDLLSKGHEVALYGSSVGGSIAIQALPHIIGSVAAVLNSPVIDPVGKAAQMVAMFEGNFQKALAEAPEDQRAAMMARQPLKLLEAVVLDKAPLSIDIPVSYNKETQENPGSVPIKTGHFNDVLAYRLLRNADAMFPGLSDAALARMACIGKSASDWIQDTNKSGGLSSLTVMADPKDMFCPLPEAQTFVNLATAVTKTPVEHIQLTAGHNDLDAEKALAIENSVRKALSLPLKAPAA